MRQTKLHVHNNSTLHGQELIELVLLMVRYNSRLSDRSACGNSETQRRADYR